MRRPLVSALVLVTVLGAAGSLTLDARAELFGKSDKGDKPLVQVQMVPQSFSALSEKLLPSVVNISTQKSVPPEEMPELPEFPQGSPVRRFLQGVSGQAWRR